MVGITRCKVIVCFFLFFFCFFFCFWKVAAFKAFSIRQPSPAPAPPSQPAPQASSPPAPPRLRARRPCPGPVQQPRPYICIVHTHTFYCFAIGAAMGNILNPKQHCFAISTAMGSILNPKQYCCAISSITTTRCWQAGCMRHPIGNANVEFW